MEFSAFLKNVFQSFSEALSILQVNFQNKNFMKLFFTTYFITVLFYWIISSILTYIDLNNKPKFISKYKYDHVYKIKVGDRKNIPVFITKILKLIHNIFYFSKSYRISLQRPACLYK